MKKSKKKKRDNKKIAQIKLKYIQQSTYRMNYRKTISNKQKYTNIASSTSLCLSSTGTKNMIRSNRQRNKTQYQQQQLTNIFHTNETIMYCSPHLLLEKQHVEKIFIDEHIMSCCEMDMDVQFMGCCRAVGYSIRDRLIMSDLGSQVKEVGADRVVSNISANLVFQKQQLKSNKTIKQFTFPKSQVQDDISVISNFEGGNMCSKIKISSSEYFLILKNDTNTLGYTQWFQFYLHANPCPNEVQNEGKIIKFVIINIRKQIKYVEGMKLLTRQVGNSGHGHYSQNWQRNLSFVTFPTDICNQTDKKYYGIAFCIPLKLIQHGIFVSLNYPYPFSRLKFLAQRMSYNQSNFKAIQIGKSLLGNPILVFTHSAPIVNNKKNRNIIILSRQHSSQISSSFICQFILKKLSYFTNSQQLTESVNWHIIPIANPDGVIHGNSRTNIKGYDINRCWSPYLYHLSPQVQSISAYLQSISISSDDLMIDLHSHSRDFGVFTYANESNQFVRCFQDKMKDVCHYFDMSKCRIGREDVKINKFRVQMQTRLKVRNIITIETSYYGYVSPENMQVIPFTIQDYNKLAGFILEGIEHFIKEQKIAQKQANETKKTKRQQIKIEDEQSSFEQQNQSDSDPQSDYMNENDRISMTNQENTKKLMILRQRNKKQNIKYMYQSSSSRQNNNRRYDNKNNETIVNQINVINLYQASHNSQYLKQQQSFLLRRNRAVSACQRVNSNFRISMQSSQRSKQVLVVSQNMKEMASERQQNQSTNIVQRNSFKKLFACAQLRYSSESQQFIRNISQQRQRKHRENLRKSLKQKKTAYQHVKTLDAPFSNQNNTHQLSQLKQIEESLRKRINSKNSKGFYFNRKQKQKIQVSNKKANDKIALLCQYAKKISCQQLFF